MNKIKVCHIITKLELGGAQQNTLFTVSHLDQNRFIPYLISGEGGILDNDAINMTTVNLYFVPQLIREIHPVKDMTALFKIWLLLIKIKPHIVHTHSSKAGILGRIAAFFARVPVIVHTFHGFGFHDFQKPLTKHFYILSEILTAAISDKLIAVSMENIFKGLKYNIGSKEKYTLIRSGIDTNLYKNINLNKDLKRKELEIEPGKKVVTTIGPFKQQKNLKDFISVAELIYKKNPETVFLVAGDGELRLELEQQIRIFKLENTVKLLGWRKDITEILAITDVFVMTSLWEGLPRSILEAMCSELPVVANSVDGVSEIVKHGITGFLVEPNNLAKMSNCIEILLTDDRMAKAFGAKAKLTIDLEFNITHMVKQQEELYIELIK